MAGFGWLLAWRSGRMSSQNLHGAPVLGKATDQREDLREEVHQWQVPAFRGLVGSRQPDEHLARLGLGVPPMPRSLQGLREDDRCWLAPRYSCTVQKNIVCRIDATE
ncbi:hypothetical protein Taro_032682 [Colocasia esculenta]|uniref:Uncharacterized protein n=1 Tax=Colocasia esculenta TaxID=4460 RepID=A0A843VLX9_COLES|nr:hypothetical protein [Colocasia esculenta]